MDTPPVYTQAPFYPYDWGITSYNIKQARRWTCQRCGIVQGDDLLNNITTHHRDHNTSNNDPSNLEVLCQVCHLREEGRYRLQSNYIKSLNQRLSQGQRILPGFATFIESKLNKA